MATKDEIVEQMETLNAILVDLLLLLEAALPEAKAIRDSRYTDRVQ